MSDRMEIERLTDLELELAESPRWDADEQALYWLEIWNPPSVFRWDPVTCEVKRWDPGVHVTGQARRAGGGFILATRTGLYLWNEHTRTGDSDRRS